MSLIICTECNKEMSDTLDACPHCGYRKEPCVKSTPLGKSKIGYIGGSFYLLLAAAFAYVAISTVRDSTTIFGIDIVYVTGWGFVRTGEMLFVLIAFSLASAVYGVICFIGWRKTTCPYCGKTDSIRRHAQRLKCRYCKKISVRNGDSLEIVK